MLYTTARFWSFTVLSGAEAVVATAMATARRRQKIHSGRAIFQWQSAHTYITVITPALSGEYPIPKSMRHPKKTPDGPGHQRPNHPIQQNDDSQRHQGADILRTERRNNFGEEEARCGEFLSKRRKSINSTAHDIYIVLERLGVSYHHELSTAACSLSREVLGLG